MSLGGSIDQSFVFPGPVHNSVVASFGGACRRRPHVSNRLAVAVTLIIVTSRRDLAWIIKLIVLRMSHPLARASPQGTAC